MIQNGQERYDAVVVGAGVAGLTAAALLADARLRTLVVERHNVPGGSASFYQRGGYRFDVGATLVGGFGPRGAHRVVNARLGIVVSARAVEPAMIVHLPSGSVARYGDERWRGERLRMFGPEAERFWRAQERIADLAWDFSARCPALPVDGPGAWSFARALRTRQLSLLPTLGRTVASLYADPPPAALRAFVDAQLLITAQAGATEVDLAYGATALDLAREGTYHVPGGVGSIAVALGRAARRRGATIRYNCNVTEILTGRHGVSAVRLSDGVQVACRQVVAAVPAQDAARLCVPLARHWRERLAALPQRWGAFTLYCGLPRGVVPDDIATHHQVVADADAPLGEGNTAFLSFSDAADPTRARGGGRAVTISTHTDVARWERAHADGRLADLRAEYVRRLGRTLERVVPGAFERAEVLEPADPHTFARYTGRWRGLVGGLPQTPATVRAFSHRSGIAGLWLCGDTVFPGQSTVGATLSGLNAARAVLWPQPSFS